MTKYAGADWIKKDLQVDMSPLGEAVADLLGDVWYGIYHLDERSLSRVDWGDGFCIRYTLRGSLATWDFNHLTTLVVLSHDRLIRFSIEGVGPDYIRLMFHQRETRKGSTMERLPTIEEHIKLIRQHYGEI